MDILCEHFLLQCLTRHFETLQAFFYMLSEFARKSRGMETAEFDCFTEFTFRGTNIKYRGRDTVIIRESVKYLL